MWRVSRVQTTNTLAMRVVCWYENRRCRWTHWPRHHIYIYTPYRRTGSPSFLHLWTFPTRSQMGKTFPTGFFTRARLRSSAAAPVLLFNTSLIRWNGCRSPHHHHHQHHSTANNATDVSYFSLTFLFYRCSLLILSTRWHFFLEKEKTRKYLLKKDIFRHTCVCVVNVVTYNVCCLHRQLDVHFIDILFNDFG